MTAEVISCRHHSTIQLRATKVHFSLVAMPRGQVLTLVMETYKLHAL